MPWRDVVRFAVVIPAPLVAAIALIMALVTAVKEFSQDVRRVAAIRETAPRLEVLCGCDDVFVESMLPSGSIASK